MFGHHSKSNTNIASANDFLNSAVYGDFVPPKGRANYARSVNSLLNLSDIPTDKLAMTSKPALSSIAPDFDHARKYTKPKWVKVNNLSTSSIDLQRTVSFESGKGKYILPESCGGSNLSTTLSNLSIGNSENNFMTSPELMQINAPRHINDDEYEAITDEGSAHSDSSSQFSFVKDIRGGRNTSVKYYKTKSSKTSTRVLETEEALRDHDMGYEDGVLSDYDFDNNGFGYEEEGEDFNDFEGGAKYNEFLRDDFNDVGLGLSGADVSPDGIFSRELHPSSPVGSIELDLPPTAASPINSTYQSELLDAYLGDTSSKLPEPKWSFKSLDVGLADPARNNPGSPLVNGVTFGTEQRIKSSRKNKRSIALLSLKAADEESNLSEQFNLFDTVDTSKTNRDSISTIMCMIKSLENKTKEIDRENAIEESNFVQSLKTFSSDVKENPKNKDKRASTRNLIANMMDTLANLEETFKSPEEVMSSNEGRLINTSRSSVIDMMNTLKFLETSVCHDSNSTKFDESKKKTSYGVPESIHSRGTSSGTEKRDPRPESDFYQRIDVEDIADIPFNALEDDLVDEVNMIPEEYEDEEYRDVKDLPQFLRSNSYNKKPQKMLIDNSLQQNKIETSSKTVTFYNKNNSLQSELSTCRSTSRVGSFQSTTSGTSINEEEILPKETTRPKGHTHTNVYTSSHFNSRSHESIAYRPYSLEPITEFNSPSL